MYVSNRESSKNFLEHVKKTIEGEGGGKRKHRRKRQSIEDRRTNKTSGLETEECKILKNTRRTSRDGVEVLGLITYCIFGFTNTPSE